MRDFSEAKLQANLDSTPEVRSVAAFSTRLLGPAEGPIAELIGQGQAIWLDSIRRSLIGLPLDELIRESGVSGITSNPAIFEAAIARSSDYDAALTRLLENGDRAPIALCEALMIEDIQAAADQLLPIFEAHRGGEGFVSLEVSPYLAFDAAATIGEARRLWRAVARPNLMIKVPGTRNSALAIETLIGEGINVNVTLLFGLGAYRQVAEAYLRGLEKLAESRDTLDGVAGVASFFVSRIDTAVDTAISEALERLPPDAEPGLQARLSSLAGQVAIANAKAAYQNWQSMIESPRWRRLADRGARPQRLLWASTGTKNPAYRDVLYVEALIGPNTVNTLPPPTLEAFRDHGRVPGATVADDVEQTQKVLETLAECGISLDAITDRLVEDGVRLFADAQDRLLATLESRRRRILADRVNSQRIHLPPALQQSLDAELETWRREGSVRRLWAGDASLWSDGDEARWLGWLSLLPLAPEMLAKLAEFTDRCRGYSSIVLLGMGGSSLGPEVISEVFGAAPGSPSLRVIDSTDPVQIAEVEEEIVLSRTLFIVASKSGSTLEPNVLMEYFLDRMRQELGVERAAQHFVAVTDPGSNLELTAREAGFSDIFFGLPTVGGRYSVLSAFGLLPAAAIGVDIARLQDSAMRMVRSCGADVPPAQNPGVQLGLAIGLAARRHRDKLTLLAGPGLGSVGAWIEQLVAESLGKQGRGVIPVNKEPFGDLSVYGDDRIFVHLNFNGERNDEQSRLDALAAAGHPVIQIGVDAADGLAQEFFRWEIATAVAGAVIGVHPFDQPDVEAAKIQTRRLTDEVSRSGSLPPEAPFFEDLSHPSEPLKFIANAQNEHALSAAAGTPISAAGLLRAHFARLQPGDYAAMLAYLPRRTSTRRLMINLRSIIRERHRVATCVGFGPRFLHSTGQAYKGGPNSGVFLQITCDDACELPIPGRNYGFGTVKAAQARGDFEVLAERGRRLLRVHLGANVERGLLRLIDLLG